MNKSDSERIATVLQENKFKEASNLNEADLILVNMCSVRQSAVDRVYGLIPKLKALKTKNKKLKTILTGCILKEDRKKLSKKFDLIFDIKKLPLFSKILKENRSYGPVCRSKTSLENNCDYLKIQPKYQTFPKAFVPISTGCNNFCSFCVVPFTRGKEISRPAKEIILEIKNLIKRGYKEIVLLGQNVNSYCSFSPLLAKKRINFPALLKLIDQLPGDFQISFLTSHPKDFSEELIEVISKSKKIKKEIHLPVQSGDNQILKKMNRGYTREEYLNLIKKIRKKIPNVKISTDIIVGFPSETKKQFENTVDLVKKAKFEKIYVAKYSPRKGTVAAKMKDNVSLKEKKRRWKIIFGMNN
jgi:tRNA-2-methylthio-N6-dimethylallyladenosine synthase